MKALPKSFYARDSATVAGELLGKLLVRRIEGEKVVCRVVETEAYYGPGDPASHAFKGPTPRSSIMFGPPGKAYVYFTYGMHHLLNAVTEQEGLAGAVLFRALQPLEGVEVLSRYRMAAGLKQLTSGPAKLTQALNIDLRLNGADLSCGELFIAEAPAPEKIEVTRRVGISAGIDLPLRFFVADNPFVSK